MFAHPSSRLARFARLRLERLEDRAVPAVVNWTLAGNGDFANLNNWTVAGTTTHRIPIATDDAIIPSQFSVTSSANVTVNSLAATNFLVLGGTFTIIQTFTQTAGTTTVAAGATLQANVQLNGGTLAGAGAVVGNVSGAGAVSPAGVGAFGSLTLTGNVSLGGTYFADVSFPAFPSVHWVNSHGGDVNDLTNGQTFVTDFKGTDDLTLTLTGSTDGTNGLNVPFVASVTKNNPGYLYGFVGSTATGTGNGDTGTVRFLRTDHDSANCKLDFRFAQPLTSVDRLVIEDVDVDERYQLTAYVRNGTTYQQVSMANWRERDFTGQTGIEPNGDWPSWDGTTGILAGKNKDLPHTLIDLRPDVSQLIDRVVIDKTASTNGLSDITFVRFPEAGTHFDQLDVTGTVALSGPLVVNVNSYIAPGVNIRLIDNQGTGAVVGTFAGLPEGATVTVSGQTFTISYVDGTGNDVVLTRVATPPRVVATQVNGGAAQRSMVTTLAVTFDMPVTFASTETAAFTLTRIGGGVVNFTATASNATGVTVVTLSGFTGAAASNGSLADGRYTLTALASQISAEGFQLDGNGNGIGGDNFTFADSSTTSGNQLYRLYGDADGNRIVNAADLTLFRTAFGAVTTDITFDSDLSGVINAIDLTAFRTNFGVVI